MLLEKIFIFVILSQLPGIWLSEGVRLPSFDQVPVAQRENSWLVFI